MKAKPRTPGPHGIHNNLLKHLPEDTLKITKEILNKIWTSGDFPHPWRATTVIPIPKSNKDQTDPLSYRPIALTSCLCKVLEHMINTRLIWHLEKSRILDKSQCGFRKHHSTTDHLVCLERYPGCFCPEAAGGWSLLWLGESLWDNLTIWYHPRPLQDWPQRQTAYFCVRISQGPANPSQNWDNTLWWILPRGRCSNWWCPVCDLFWTED